MALSSWVYDVPVIVGILVTIEDALTITQVIRAYRVVQLYIELDDILNWLLCLLLHEIVRRVLGLKDLTWWRLMESAARLTMMMMLLLMAVQRVQRLQLLLN